MRFGGDQPYVTCDTCGHLTTDHIGPGTLNPDCHCCSWRKSDVDSAPATAPRVPSWVADPVKWASLPRRERRALERHHRKVNRNGHR